MFLICAFFAKIFTKKDFQPFDLKTDTSVTFHKGNLSSKLNFVQCSVFTVDSGRTDRQTVCNA